MNSYISTSTCQNFYIYLKSDIFVSHVYINVCASKIPYDFQFPKFLPLMAQSAEKNPKSYLETVMLTLLSSYITYPLSTVVYYFSNKIQIFVMALIHNIHDKKATLANPFSTAQHRNYK